MCSASLACAFRRSQNSDYVALLRGAPNHLPRDHLDQCRSARLRLGGNGKRLRLQLCTRMITTCITAAAHRKTPPVATHSPRTGVPLARRRAPRASRCACPSLVQRESATANPGITISGCWQDAWPQQLRPHGRPRRPRGTLLHLACAPLRLPVWPRSTARTCFASRMGGRGCADRRRRRGASWTRRAPAPTRCA